MTLPELAQSAFLRALGWAVLNSLWQFTFLWLIFILFVSVAKGLSSRIKHGAALLLLFAGSCWFLLELSLYYFTYKESLDSTSPSNLFPEAFSSKYFAAQKFVESNLPYISFVYLLIAGILFIQFCFYFYQSRLIRTRGLTKTSAQLRLYVNQRAQHLGIGRKVQVWISEYVNTPVIIGFVKPMILIPVACVNQLSTQQLEAVLLHELAHIKRNDYLVNLLVATSEILFFFNPFAKLLVKVINQERETSCDDWVLQFKFNPHQYASALLSLEQSRSSSLVTCLAATGKSNGILLYRIQRIMKIQTTEKTNGLRFLAYFLTIGLFHSLAFMNPEHAGVKKISNSVHAETIKQMTATMNKKSNLPISSENVKIENTHKPLTKTAETARIAFNAKPMVKPNLLEDPLAIFIRAYDHLEPELKLDLVSAIDIEQRDYSIIENVPPVKPSVAFHYEHPFVPNSSFSYQEIEDTTKVKTKVEDYRQRITREGLLKAKEVIKKLDWKNMEKQFRSKADLAKVRKAIQQSLELLNWQEINEEVRQKLNKENIEKLRSSLRIEYDELKNLRTQQQQYEKLHNELKLQQEKYKRDIEQQGWEINKQMAKEKAIVHI